MSPIRDSIRKIIDYIQYKKKYREYYTKKKIAASCFRKLITIWRYWYTIVAIRSKKHDNWCKIFLKVSKNIHINRKIFLKSFYSESSQIYNYSITIKSATKTGETYKILKSINFALRTFIRASGENKERRSQRCKEHN